jgi:hypothetical protein
MPLMIAALVPAFNSISPKTPHFATPGYMFRTKARWHALLPNLRHQANALAVKG